MPPTPISATTSERYRDVLVPGLPVSDKSPSRWRLTLVPITEDGESDYDRYDGAQEWELNLPPEVLAQLVAAIVLAVNDHEA